MPKSVKEPKKRRLAIGRAAFLVLVVTLGFGIWVLFVYPESPLTNAWDPTTPLDVRDPVTPLTSWKFNRALQNRAACLAALKTGAQAQILPDHKESAVCFIRPQVNLSRVGQSKVKPLNTRCQTALRLAMWERHGVQPAAQKHLGHGVRQILHYSSYNCRRIRSTRGSQEQMSTHATADAIDVSGFELEGGRKITLLSNWSGDGADAAFLAEVRDSACRWFRLTLGPEYNSLHADHFHLQHTGWGLCS